MQLLVYVILCCLLNKITSLTTYNIVLSIGSSGSLDNFEITVYGKFLSISLLIDNPPIKANTTHRQTKTGQNVGMIEKVHIKALGLDGIFINFFTITTSFYVTEFECNCIVDEQITATLIPNKIICLVGYRDFFCDIIMYNFDVTGLNSNASSENVEYSLSVVGSQRTANFTRFLDNTTSNQLNFSLPLENIGMLKEVFIRSNSGLEIRNSLNLTVFDGIIKVEVACVSEDIRKVTNHLNATNENTTGAADKITEAWPNVTDIQCDIVKVICFSGWKEDMCDEYEHEFTITVSDKSELDEFHKVHLKLEVKYRNGIDAFKIDTYKKADDRGIFYLTEITKALSSARFIIVEATATIKSVVIYNGYAKHLFGCNCKKGNAHIVKHYCLDGWNDQGACRSVTYTIAMTIGERWSDGSEGRLTLTIKSRGKSSKIYFPDRPTKWNDRIVTRQLATRIEDIEEIIVASELNDTVYVKLIHIYDGRVEMFYERIEGKYSLMYRICPPGYTGKGCMGRCASHTWGSNCTKKCNCFDNSTCHRVSGYCPNGCLRRSPDLACTIICDREHFGYNCSSTCHCLNTSSCDVRTGSCDSSGCKKGWSGPSCQTPVCLPNHVYGLGCFKNCHCSNNDTCNSKTGVCPSGCHPLYYGAACQSTCLHVENNSTTSTNCSTKCLCDFPDQCSVLDGKCMVGGCKRGLVGAYCNQTCLYGGPQCSNPCECNGDPCNNITGECLCTHRRVGKSCEFTCPENNFLYKNECNGVCHCSENSYCNVSDGDCTLDATGCKMGWTGANCQQKLGDDKSSHLTVMFVLLGITAAVLFVAFLIAGAKKLHKIKKSSHKDTTSQTTTDNKKSMITWKNSLISKIHFGTHKSPGSQQPKGTVRIRVPKDRGGVVSESNIKNGPDTDDRNEALRRHRSVIQDEIERIVKAHGVVKKGRIKRRVRKDAQEIPPTELNTSKHKDVERVHHQTHQGVGVQATKSGLHKKKHRKHRRASIVGLSLVSQTSDRDNI